MSAATQQKLDNEIMTTDQGVRIGNTDDSLKAGIRGPTLLEDFILREKIMRFDHERIPERAVHARGSAAHGYFELYDDSLKDKTMAGFLTNTKVKTPVFVRFSTVAGSRGSADLARDVRGFATKFYTTEGNFDLVGNNMPVFFIQDGIKFPDVIHAVKPEPHNEIPQAASAHDTFWDFISLTPESTHMIMWAMSDRAIPRSYARMEGFGVHTFRLINANGKSTLCKFHWKPLAGMHSVTWDEAQKINGFDSDFHRRDLYELIENKLYPEYELGLQLIEEEDVLKYGFDLLDATKLLPEEIVPVKIIGKMTLDRNPDDFFAETEQVAFCVSNVVPGIDFTEDPLMQARLFSYLDTQLSRLGGPNFAQIPINRPIIPVSNNSQEGHMQMNVKKKKANYFPNSIDNGCPFLAGKMDKPFIHYQSKMGTDSSKIRERSDSFKDFYSQAKMFYKSLSSVEQRHLVNALRFELGKLKRKGIRERVLGNLSLVDTQLAQLVSDKIGVPIPPQKSPNNKNSLKNDPNFVSPKLSMLNTIQSIKGKVFALLIAQGANYDDAMNVKKLFVSNNSLVHFISTFVGDIKTTANDKTIESDASFLTTNPVLYDGVYICNGIESVKKLEGEKDSILFIQECYKHCKPIGTNSDGLELLKRCQIDISSPGISTNNDNLINVFTQHRYWERETEA